MLIYDNLEIWTKSQPQKTALIYSNMKLSYEELAQKANSIACCLSSIIKKGKTVLINHQNPITQLLFLFGVSKAGGASVLINNSISGKYLKQLITCINPVLYINDKYSFEINKSGKLPKVKPDDIFLGALSSGSTGLPKLIWRDHQSWVSAFPFQSKVFSLSNSDRLYLAGSLTYTANLNSCLHLLYEGGTVIFAENNYPKSWQKEILKHNISSIFMVPAHYRLLNKVIKTPVLQVKSIVSAGSKLDIQTIHNLISNFPDTQLFEYYGAVELGHVSFANTEELLKQPDSVGKAFPNVKLDIEDSMILVESPYLAHDYKPVATIGEMGRIDNEGNLFLLGRKDFVINSGGLKIIPEQLEKIINGFPGVAECIVKGIDDPARGQKVAVWVVKDNPVLSVKDLKLFCNKHLPKNYCPKQIYFIESLPLNINGKIDRSRL